MFRLAIAFFLLLSTFHVLAQTYAGTWTAKHPSGGGVTMTLERAAEGQLTGTLEGNSNSFQVAAEISPEGILGEIVGQNVFIKGLVKEEQLHMLLFELGPDGRPNRQSFRAIVFSRAAGEGSAAPRRKPNGELARLLSASPWCSFTYNQRSGTSARERLVFRADGRVLQQDGAETYSSGAGGVVAGEHRGAKQARWKVANGSLQLSEDGAAWTPQPLQVTRNSNGYPIIKSACKEYMQCD